MTYQDQRNDEHPEAVRSDPVPVQRSAPDDDLDNDTDRDGVDDRVEDRTDAERGFHEGAEGYHDNVRDEGLQDTSRDEGLQDTSRDEGFPDSARDEGFHDSSAAEPGQHDNVTAEADADRDGVDDRVDDAEVRDDTDVYHEAEDERTGYDEPVIASPVDTDVERSGVDSAELDRDRADDERTFGGPTFPESAMAPAAFGAATASGAAAAAAMAANRTDTRIDAEAVDDRTDADRGEADLAEGDRADRDRVDADRTADDVAATESVDHDEPTELMPGEVEAEPVTALVAVEAAQGFRDRWREVQLRFVDDPRGAAGEAQGLAEEAADALVAALDAMRSDLGGWEATESADTEHLRVVVRRYRDFLDRVLQS